MGKFNKLMRSRKMKSFVIIGMLLCMILTGLASAVSVVI